MIRSQLAPVIGLCLLFLLDRPCQAAPIIELLYVEDQVLDGAENLPGFDALRDRVRQNGQRRITTAINGNFVGAVNTDSSQGNSGFVGTYYLFGSSDNGVTPTALVREATLGGLEQETLGSNGIDLAGNVTYSATIVNPNAPPNRFSSLWENETNVFVEGDTIPVGPLAGHTFESAGGVYRSPSGVSSWISQYDGTQSGYAIFQDTTDFNVLLKSGDTIGSEGTIVDESFAISGNIRWSDSGTHYITGVDVESGFTDTDELPVVNGAPVTTPSGAIIREGNLVPAADGGLPGETWDLAGLYDINDSGDFVFSAFNDNVVNDSILALNGQILHRENDTVDGVSLAGQVQGVAINNAGDVAFVWNDTVFINDQKVAGLGTLVDTDGDDVGDDGISNLSLGRLEITDQLAAGGDGLPVVYFAGRISGDRSMYVRLAPATGDPDFDGDLDVDGTDLLIWQRGFDSGTSQGEGDADGDGDVDADDLSLWRAGYGNTLPVATAAVPEPSTIILLLGALPFSYLATRLRCRHNTKCCESTPR